MPAFICTACGTQYAPADAAPQSCIVCDDERQYVPPRGQTWTTLPALAAGHFNGYREYEPGVIGVGTQPAFAIGQRALILRTAGGNVLWDCISMIDAATVTLIDGLGGLKAIAISHPHFYTSMVEWSGADREWIMRPDPAIKPWTGDTFALLPGVTLIRCGGHFPGGTVLHWDRGGRGVLCSGDIATVATDRKSLTFMRSYPNFIPLSEREVEAIAAAPAPFDFDTIYGHYFDRVIRTDAKAALRASVARYLAAIAGGAIMHPNKCLERNR